MSPYPGTMRASDGYIVTCVELGTGETQTIHRKGFVRWRPQPERVVTSGTDLLLELAEELDARPGEWRIRSISSPTSILADLKRAGHAEHVPSYEAMLLGKIDRLDLYEGTVRTKKASRKQLHQWEQHQ